MNVEPQGAPMSFPSPRFFLVSERVGGAGLPGIYLLSTVGWL